MSLIRLGQAERAGQFLAGLGEQDRDRGEIRVAAAALRLAQGDPQAALAALAPIQQDPVAEGYRGFWRARADMLEAIARDALGDPDAADAALERALDLSETSGDLTAFLLYPAAGLLERHARHRTAHAALVAEIRGLLAGTQAEPRHGAPPPSRPEPLLEPLSGSEVRVLRYLPTNLTATGDRPRAVGLPQHRQDPHQAPVRQIRHPPPRRSRRPRPRPRPARPRQDGPGPPLGPHRPCATRQRR